MRYDIPAAPPPAEGVIVTLGPVVDAREARGEIERFLEQAPAEEVAAVFTQELLATGHVARVLRTGDAAANLAIDAELRDLRWEAPSHETNRRTGAVVGVLTGGIGGGIYGMTPTDVYGHSRLFVRVRALGSGATLLEREYVGTVHRRVSKVGADSGGTRVEMASLAVQALMADVRRDLVPLFAANEK